MDVLIRELYATDLKNGFFPTIRELGEVLLSDKEITQVFQSRLRAGVLTYIALVGDEVIGTASLLVEPKFIHNGGKVAHVEDVAVRSDYQGLGVGRMLMERVEVEAKQRHCYKIILDCADKNVAFYTKLGYRKHSQQMRKDL